MSTSPRVPSLVLVAACAVSGIVQSQTMLPPPNHAAIPHQGLAWTQLGKNPFHSAIAGVAGQSLTQIHWSTPVDLQPPYSGGNLLIHYGSPLITKHGTLVLGLKTGFDDGFEMRGKNAANGAAIWSATTDYLFPPHNWVPTYGCALTPGNGVAFPGEGGTVFLRENADAASSTVRRIAFYGLANYDADPAAYAANVFICTPITSDERGNLYFGFFVMGATPIGLESGIARISPSGDGRWVSAATAAGDLGIQKVCYNSAPALARDGESLYVAVNDVFGSGFGAGYLLRLDARNLATLATVRLVDAAVPANDAVLPDDGSSSPTVGPDGDVYFGVLENPFGAHHFRGWLKHFDAALSQEELPGGFGWDDSPSIVPASAVPSYAGPSSYLVLSKYNDYAGAGGDGANKVAVLDPSTSMIDPISGIPIMNEVLTKVGPTPDPNYFPTFPNAVREWCINTAAVDPSSKCAYVNNEDGKLYRWDFTTNTLSQTVVLTAGIGEAYTPTIVGPDGTVYAINDATLFAVGN